MVPLHFLSFLCVCLVFANLTGNTCASEHVIQILVLFAVALMRVWQSLQGATTYVYIDYGVNVYIFRSSIETHAGR